MEGSWEKVEIENGITIFYRKTTGPTIASILLRAGGARYDPVGKEGVAHFSEHLLGKWGGRFATETLTELYALQHGIVWNLRTDLDSIIIEAMAPPEETENLLTFLSVFTGNSSLDEKMIKKEKVVILSEMSTWQKRKEWVEAEIEVRRVLFGDHPFARIVAESGTPWTLERITLQDIIDHRNRFLIASNIVIVILTPRNLTTIIEKIEENFNLPPAPKIDYPIPLKDFPKPSKNTFKFSYSEFEKCPRRKEIGEVIEIYFAIPTAVSGIFWDMIASLLILTFLDELRYKLKLTYGVSLRGHRGTDLSFIVIHANTVTKKGQKLQEAIFDTLKKLITLEPFIFRLIKQRKIAELIEAPPEVMAREAIQNVKIFGSPGEAKEKMLKKVSLAEVGEWVNAWLNAERAVVKHIVP